MEKFRLILDAEFEEQESSDELNKAVGDKKKRMIVKGLVSTPTKDADGETLIPSGFDLSYLKAHGFINWNHQAKKDPDAIIGEPLDDGTTVDGDKFMVKAELYDTPLARKVFKLGNLLKKSKSKRKLAFSLEGYATQRNKEDKKVVEKAMITHVAITPAPKNTDSYLELEEKSILDEIWHNVTAGEEVEKVVDCNGDSICLMGDASIRIIEKSHDSEVIESSEGTEDAGMQIGDTVSDALSVIASAHNHGLLSSNEIEAVRSLFSSFE